MDSCAIYGLESQGRALCSHTSEQEVIRFFVGTLSTRSEGQVHQIEFDDETNHITRKIFKPRVGEIWQLQCSPSDKNLIALTYNHITSTTSQFKSGLWEIPDPAVSENNQELKLISKFEPDDDSLRKQDCRGVDWHPSKPGRIASVYDRGFVVWDMNDGQPMVKSIHLADPNCPKIYTGKWNPHLDGNQFTLVCGKNVNGIDTRSMKSIWTFESAHKFQVRDVDFNPNKQYCFATCGDDCTAKFWDIRKPNECLKVISEHSHWVWRVRFNSFHDQLVLTAGSDSRVLLHCLTSISSEPRGHVVFSEGEDDEAPQKYANPLEEGVLAKFEQHEDAVYVAEWSSYDPWIFASLSYDGRLVINRVPQSQKYKILL